MTKNTKVDFSQALAYVGQTLSRKAEPVQSTSQGMADWYEARRQEAKVKGFDKVWID